MSYRCGSFGTFGDSMSLYTYEKLYIFFMFTLDEYWMMDQGFDSLHCALLLSMVLFVIGMLDGLGFGERERARERAHVMYACFLPN